MQTFKKIGNLFMVITLLMQIFIMQPINASTTKIGIINFSQGKYLKKEITSSTSSSVILYDIPTKETVTILQENAGSSGNGCNSPWHYVEYKGIKGYICGTEIEIRAKEINVSAEFENYVKNNFPKSYWDKIFDLKTLFPNWNFVAHKTGLDWEDVVDNQNNDGTSLIQTNYSPYLSKSNESYNSETDQYKIKDGKKTGTFVSLGGNNWFNANSRTIEYYLDPRNFLNVKNVFMFEKLTFNEKNHTKENISKILNGTFMSGTYSLNGEQKTYTNTFYEAGVITGVNPIYLASRVIQEVGRGRSSAVSGNEFKYWVKKNYESIPDSGNYECSEDDKDNNNCIQVSVSGVYNFYNIGAYAPNENNINENWTKGLIFANGQLRQSYTGSDRPWNNEYKAIVGGAKYIDSGYISQGQDTMYFQKWNVSNYTKQPKYTHQYMTNIQAPTSEASKIYNAYNNASILDNTFIFEIPIYNNMPEKTSLPTGDSNNNNLKNIQINGKTITNFNKNTTNYTVYFPESTDSITLNVETEDSNARVEYNSTISLTTKETTYNIRSIAQDGGVKLYTIKLIKQSGDETKLKELVSNLNINIENNIINNLNNKTEIKKVIEKISKINNETTVNIFDKNLNNKTTGYFSTGDKILLTIGDKSLEYKLIVKGDSNGDGDISLIDLLHVQKYILESMNLDDLSFKALDINNDNQVNLFDLLKIQLHILGVSEIKGDVINEA